MTTMHQAISSILRQKSLSSNTSPRAVRRLHLALPRGLSPAYIIDPPPTIRLLTPKPKPGAPPPSKAIKSKGCAFLEFTSKAALQQGLRLHQSVLDGRKINVELTAGGGGNSEARLTKLKQRNKELHGQRVSLLPPSAGHSLIIFLSQEKKVEKQKDAKKDEDIASLTASKRYSATSGVEQAPANKRTWTVGDAVDDSTHRGGVKHTKKDRKRGGRSKAQVTGMNAIPVG
jgi:nucleolar protein 6